MTGVTPGELWSKFADLQSQASIKALFFLRRCSQAVSFQTAAPLCITAYRYGRSSFLLDLCNSALVNPALEARKSLACSSALCRFGGLCVQLLLTLTCGGNSCFRTAPGAEM